MYLTARNFLLIPIYKINFWKKKIDVDMSVRFLIHVDLVPHGVGFNVRLVVN